MGKVTVKTLAEALGVSPSTISNAYNKPAQLSAGLREKILAKADELGYAGPDAAGRSLRSGKSGAIGVLLTERLSYAFSDPYAIGFLAGLSEVVEKHGISIVLLPIAGDGDANNLTAVRRANIDGLTTLCVSESHLAAQVAKTRGIHLVTTIHDPDVNGDYVAIDDEEAGAMVGDHLTKLGHRQVAILVDTNTEAGKDAQVLDRDSSIVTTEDSLARLRGLYRSMPEARIELISAGHNALTSGRAAAAIALDTENRPTAIVGLSDVLALGALDALKTRGLKAPADISVCGFDDVPIAESAGLTTLRQPIAEKGRRVGELLLDRDTPDRQVLLPIELIVRSTTGPPRTTALP